MKTVFYSEIETWGDLDVIREKIMKSLQTDGQRVFVRIDVMDKEDGS